MKNILITGGAGFIGSNLALELEETGHKVVIIDDLSLGSKENLQGFKGKFYKKSILDPVGLNDIIKKHKITHIFHLAAASASPMFYKDVLHSSEVNLMGTLNVLEAARKNKVEKVVYASTSSIYGASKLPFKEYDVDLTTFYPITKFVNELYAKQYSKEGWVETTGCRFFSVYGPNEGPKGELANFLTQSIWRMIDDKPAIVYGDGKQTRDFIYVRDLCKGLIAAMKCKELNGKIVNIGTGKETNILKMVELVNKNLLTNIKPKYVPNPIKGYVKFTCSETSVMKKYLHFIPPTTLEEGIKKTIEFYI